MKQRRLVRSVITELKPGKYELRVETPPDIDGVRHFRSRVVNVKNRAAAERKLREFIVEVQNETPATKKEKDSRNMSISTLLDLFIADITSAYTPHLLGIGLVQFSEGIRIPLPASFYQPCYLHRKHNVSIYRVLQLWKRLHGDSFF